MSNVLIAAGTGAAAWLGCLAPYLSSKRQKLLPHPLPKALGWSLFVVLEALAFIGLGSWYAPLTAGLVLLTVVMCAWPFMVIASVHSGPKPALLSTLGVASLAVILALGGGH